MSEKVAIVTGANKGLGYAIVKGLCNKFDGITYLTSRNKKRGLKACEAFEKLNYKPQFHQLDVSDTDSIKTFSEYLKNRHQGVDILVNNAGILFLQDAKEPIKYQKEQTILINFFALVNFTEDILPLMKNNSRIVNISSSSGHLSRIPSKELRKRFMDPNLTLDGLTELAKLYLEAIRENKDIENGWGDNPYVISKVAVNAYTFILHRRLQDRGELLSIVFSKTGYYKFCLQFGLLRSGQPVYSNVKNI